MGRCLALRFDGSGTRLAVMCEREVLLLDVATRLETARVPNPHPENLTAFDLAANGTRLLTAGGLAAVRRRRSIARADRGPARHAPLRRVAEVVTDRRVGREGVPCRRDHRRRHRLRGHHVGPGGRKPELRRRDLEAPGQALGVILRLTPPPRAAYSPSTPDMSAYRFLDPSSASARLFAQAQRLIPGGTSKANFNVKPHPFYVASGRGCRITDLDGVERLDAINNFTALVHGHAFPPVVQAVTEQVARGSAFAASTREEVDLAQLLVERVPGVERIRFANSGTEGVMMAIKAARAYTGRDRIAKFEGAYHGYYDDVQVSFSSGPADWGPEHEPTSVPSSRGVPKHRVAETLVLPWNDRDAVERLLTRHAPEIAAVLVDPLSNRMGFIPPAPGFLDHVRRVTRALGILVIFDEVISFRVAAGGAQSRYGGDPDLTAFGKIIGGGFP